MPNNKLADESCYSATITATFSSFRILGYTKFQSGTSRLKEMPCTMEGNIHNYYCLVFSVIDLEAYKLIVGTIKNVPKIKLLVTIKI